LDVSSQNTYSYDDADRIITSKPAGSAGAQFTYDDANQLMAETASGSTYEFNLYGNRTSAGASSYTYDVANRLIGYDATTASYAYDGDGLRISKTLGSQTDQYTWDKRGRLPSIFASGNSYYIYGSGTIPIEQVTGTGAVLFYHYDQLGSTRMLTGSNGSQQASYTFDAYGNATAATVQPGVANPFGYAGAFTDAETGFLYMQARYYDPATEQFISRDPLVSMHPYAYAEDSPVNFFDPTGLKAGETDMVVTRVVIAPFFTEGLTAPALPSDNERPSYSSFTWGPLSGDLSLTRAVNVDQAAPVTSPVPGPVPKGRLRAPGMAVADGINSEPAVQPVQGPIIRAPGR
jgi:RHS repeat-associated protein